MDKKVNLREGEVTFFMLNHILLKILMIYDEECSDGRRKTKSK